MSESRFLSLLQEHQGIIQKLVALYAKDQEEKKDFYQEIVLQAWKGLASFRQEAAFSTWLYRVCLNTIFTLQRKKHPVDYTASLDELSPLVLPSSQQNEDRHLLQQAIRQLPETDRAIITMYLDGYGHTEIAQMLGITANNIAVKLHRIKQYLGTLLTK